MDIHLVKGWVVQEPLLATLTMIFINIVLLLFMRNIVSKVLLSLASRTATKVDDILVKHLHPVRISWLAPLIFTYLTAFFFPQYQSLVEKGALFGMLWIGALTINALLNAINEIYESHPNYRGVSIQSYLDIAKILIIMVAIILSVSLFSGESPLVLLTGLGALTAVLLLIFQNTILALVSSVNIATHDLIKEGDWIEVPSFGADGDVVNISLHSIKVQNFDKTFSVIPTHKIDDVAFKNWRGMQQSGGRRIQRSVLIDMTSMKFCDAELLERLCKIDLIQPYLDQRMASIAQYQQLHADHYDSPLDGPQVTNTEIFRAYIETYLRNRADIHQDGLDFLVRSLEPTPTGLPIELYIFTKTTVWKEYEAIQSEVFDHLLAAADHFDLRLFQEPTGRDFAVLIKD